MDGIGIVRGLLWVGSTSWNSISNSTNLSPLNTVPPSTTTTFGGWKFEQAQVQVVLVYPQDSLLMTQIEAIAQAFAVMHAGVPHLWFCKSSCFADLFFTSYTLVLVLVVSARPVQFSCAAVSTTSRIHVPLILMMSNQCHDVTHRNRFHVDTRARAHTHTHTHTHTHLPPCNIEL